MLCFFCMLMVTGCDSDSVTLVVGNSEVAEKQEATAKEMEDNLYKKGADTYDQTIEKYGPSGSEVSKEGKSIGAYLTSWLVLTYSEGKKAAPYIGIGSFVMGFLLFLFARGNKRIRKFGLFTLMIGVPLLLIVLVYGAGYLKNILVG